MEIAFAPGAWKAWKKLPQETQHRLKEKLLAYSDNPLKYVAKLTDPKIGQYRFRIGAYRMVFDILDDEIIILAVGHRKDIYK